MFESVKHIDVDRKNSLPISDFSNRYVATSTPVVFGDLTHRWGAFRKWNLEFFRRELGDHDINVYSHKVVVNKGDSQRPVMNLSASDYFDLLLHDEDDLQVRNLDVLAINPKLKEDFTFPRVGLKFKEQRPRLHIGGARASEHMHYRSDMSESFLCNFGGKQTVLLVRPEEAKYTYEPPLAFESLATVDYSKRGLSKNPRIAMLNAYYAELSHGDVLYIPSQYRYSVYYSTISFGLILAAQPKSLKLKFLAKYNKYVLQPIDYLAQTLLGPRWQRRKVRKAVRRAKS